MKYKNKINDIRYLIAEQPDWVKKLIEKVLENPRFATWTGSHKSKHHEGEGGLQHHTWEVMHLAKSVVMFSRVQLDQDVDKNVLMVAAAYHDIGKTYDYALVGDNWEGTKHKRTIHHITRSAMIFAAEADKIGLDEGTKDAILHCILSHHGLREWGSPVMPHSREAWILHHCDSISARMDDCSKFDWVKS